MSLTKILHYDIKLKMGKLKVNTNILRQLSELSLGIF